MKIHNKTSSVAYWATQTVSFWPKILKVKHCLSVTMLMVSIAMGGMASAAEKQLPQSRAEITLSYAPLVKATSGAVVNVYADRKVQQRSPFAGDPFFEQFFGSQMGRNTERLEQSLGSGVIIDSNGLIVTNHHVIKDADNIKVSMSDGREFSSRLLLKDEMTDLAILKIDAEEPLPVIKLSDSDQVEVGDLVLAIGNPFGVGQTVTSGIVSAQSRTQVGVSDFDFFIQTDAAINPGNSGGALIDMHGNLIGINTAIYSRSGGSVGIGFAIPSNMAAAVIKAAEAGNDRFVRPYLGASFQSVTADVAESLGMKHPVGALITDLVSDGPAAKAGLKAGDIIVGIDNVAVVNPDVLGYRLSTAGIGKKVKLLVQPAGKLANVQNEVVIALEQPPAPEPLQTIKGRNPLSGVQIQVINPEIARRAGLPVNKRGVIVAKIGDGYAMRRVNLQVGDIIRAVNGVEITSSDQLIEQLSAGEGRVWRLDIERNGVVYRQFVR